jgi:hypothetical protein
MTTHEITGIPDGYEPIDKDLNKSIRRAYKKELYLYNRGAYEWSGERPSDNDFLILKKVEKPKTYRAFQNEEEFEPFADRWIQRIDIATGGVLKGTFKVSGYNEHGVFLDHSIHRTYLYMYANYKFKNGALFGLEIT